MLNGAENITWSDAHLTPLGIQQARDVHNLWKALLPNGIPYPENYYVSPLVRAIQTADLSFKDLSLPEGKEYKPVVKELLREAIGIHTCDRRSTKSEIMEAFPHLVFEEGFAEEDGLWDAGRREPEGARRYRLSQLLDDVFGHDDNIFLSLTAHSGAIGSILEAIGHRKFALETGGVIPVLVKAKRMEGERKKPEKEVWEGPPKCEEPIQGGL